MAPLSSVNAAPGDYGSPTLSYAGQPPSPTADKAQSKVWFNAGTWWADMLHPTHHRHHVWRFDAARQIWISARTDLDPRPASRSDILWDGSRLYVVSHVVAADSSLNRANQPTLLYRYRYDAATKRYLLDAGFPTKVNNVSSEAVVLSKDATNKLWATWTQGRRIFMARSALYGTSWESAFVLPFAPAQTLKSEDSSSVATYGNVKTAVAWSNQNDSTLWFASHDDRAVARSGWTFTAVVKGSKRIDDQVVLRAFHGDRTGRLFLVAKTALDDAVPKDPAAPVIEVWVRNATTGAWTSSVASTVADNHTRATLSLDATNARVNVLMTGPSFAGNAAFEGTIYRKSAPVSALTFETGLGEPLIRQANSPRMNNATVSKQSLTTATGLLVLASNNTTSTYWHRHRALP